MCPTDASAVLSLGKLLMKIASKVLLQDFITRHIALDVRKLTLLFYNLHPWLVKILFHEDENMNVYQNKFAC